MTACSVRNRSCCATWSGSAARYYKARCNLELDTGTAVENYHGYCGNAATLELLDRADVAPH